MTKDAREARAHRHGLVRHEPLGAPTPRAQDRAVGAGGDGRWQVSSEVRRKDHAPAGGVDDTKGARICTRADNEHRRRRAELRHLGAFLIKGVAQLGGQRAFRGRGARRVPRSLRRDGAEWEAAPVRVVLTHDGAGDELGHARGGEPRAHRHCGVAEAWEARGAPRRELG